jgi:hypothetical protein
MIWPFKSKKPEPRERMIDSHPRAISFLEDVECVEVSMKKDGERKATFMRWDVDRGMATYIVLSGEEVMKAAPRPGKYKLRILAWPIDE